MLTLKIVGADSSIKREMSDENNLSLVYDMAYEEGDQIIFETNQIFDYYVLQMDDALGEAFTYITKEQVVFSIPFGEKKDGYSPKTFTGTKHLITARLALPEELKNYRNLALNVMDQHGDTGCYPHAHANVETRGETQFAAKNAINGGNANLSHGSWPYDSWGINKQDDAEITISFGRPVITDQVQLYTRCDFPHDNWWKSATLSFSDGTSLTVNLEKSSKPHVIRFEKKIVEWVKLGELIKSDDPSPYPALTQIEVYGYEA